MHRSILDHTFSVWDKGMSIDHNVKTVRRKPAKALFRLEGLANLSFAPYSQITEGLIDERDNVYMFCNILSIFK